MLRRGLSDRPAGGHDGRSTGVHAHVVGRDVAALELRLRLGFGLELLDELADSIEWETEIWEGCTVEQLVTGIAEAEFMLEAEEKEAESWGAEESER